MLASLAAVLLAGGLGACGGGSTPGAPALVRETFRSHGAIDSGRIELSFALQPVGSPGALAGVVPFAVSLQGSFQSLGTARLPRFALELDLSSPSLSSAGHALRVGATSTADRLFIEIGGTQFLAPASTLQALRQGYAQATRSSSAAAAQSTFAALGVHPGAWLVHPTVVGPADIAGAETIHISAGLNLAGLLADVGKLSGVGGSLALGTGGQGTGGQSPGLVAPGRILALLPTLRSGRVDLYTGVHDHLLRRLTLRAAVSPTPQTRPSLAGLSGATLTLALQFVDLNRPQAILAPANPQPISKLGPALRALDLTPPSAAGG